MPNTTERTTEELLVELTGEVRRQRESNEALLKELVELNETVQNQLRIAAQMRSSLWSLGTNA